MKNSHLAQPQTMEEAILAGKKTYKEFPQMGTEQFLIKVEVCAWLWRQARSNNETSTLDSHQKILSSMAILNLMTRITT